MSEAKAPAPAASEKKPEPKPEPEQKAPRLKLPAVGGVNDVLAAVVSKDRSTRRMGWFFWLSISGIIAVGAAAAWHYRALQDLRHQLDAQAKKDSQNLGDFLQKTSDESKKRAAGLELGSFQVELKPVPGQENSHSTMNTAEFEIFVQTDKATTRAFLESHNPQVRNEILIVFVSVDRETLLTREGKQKMKRAVIDRLNDWLPAGKIEDLFFTKMILN